MIELINLSDQISFYYKLIMAVLVNFALSAPSTLLVIEKVLNNC